MTYKNYREEVEKDLAKLRLKTQQDSIENDLRKLKEQLIKEGELLATPQPSRNSNNLTNTDVQLGNIDRILQELNNLIGLQSWTNCYKS
jgi:cob(I)alamin adenosyltransferase